MNDVKVLRVNALTTNSKPHDADSEGHIHMPHPTTSTDLSDALSKLSHLNDRIDQATWMPQEQLVAMLLAGSMIIDAIVNGAEMTQFTDDEVDFISNMHERIGETMNDLMSNDKDAM